MRIWVVRGRRRILASVVWQTDVEFGHDASSFIAGGHIGLQHQFGKWVAGIEVSWSGTDLTESTNFIPPPPAAPSALRTESEISSLFLETARLGYVWDRWLGYVKGGYASAEVEFTTTFRPTGATINASSDREHGWTVGTGLEYAVSPNIILGLEYHFVRLDIGDPGGTNSLGCVGNGCFVANADADIHSVMARLSIKLRRRRGGTIQIEDPPFGRLVKQASGGESLLCAVATAENVEAFSIEQLD